MTDQDIPEWAPKESLKTFHDASFDSENERYCFEGYPEASIRALYFDEIQGNWYDNSVGKGHSPCRCDALYVKQGSPDYYFIEFKAGGVAQLNLFRKIYDSVIALVDKGSVKSVECCRSSIVYIVVTPNANTSNWGQAINFVSDVAIKRKWNSSTYKAEWDLYKLENWLLKKVLTLSPEEFARYVKDQGWT